MKQNVLVFALIAVIIGGGSFYGGMKYEQSKTPVRQIGANGQGFRGTGAGAGRAQGGFRPVNGDIISSDSTSITVKLADGTSRIVFISDKTNINKAGTAARSELIVGAKVAVFGTTNADGSVTAQNVQLNPIERMPSPSASPTQ